MIYSVKAVRAGLEQDTDLQGRLFDAGNAGALSLSEYIHQLLNEFHPQVSFEQHLLHWCACRPHLFHLKQHLAASDNLLTCSGYVERGNCYHAS